MTITKTQSDIILGMARNIMQDAINVVSAESLGREYLLRQEYIMKARNELDFRQRRLEAYLKGLVE